MKYANPITGVSKVSRKSLDCRSRRAIAGAVRRTAFTTEALEERRLLCSLPHLSAAHGALSEITPPIEATGGSQLLNAGIVWSNRGSSGNDSDGFNAVFGIRSNLARSAADAAFQSWSRAIQNFNNGTNTISISLSMSGVGLGGSGGVSSVSNGRPTSGSIGLAGGNDGHGSGYFLDASPYDNSEFAGGIVNAFAGDAQVGSPAAGLADLYTVVLLETSHVLGFAKNADLRIWTSGLLTNTGIDIPAGGEEGGAGAGGLNNTYWLFNGPSVKALFNGSNTNLPADAQNAVHVAGPSPTGAVTYNGQNYYGFEDSNNAFFEQGRRYLPSRVDSLILQDAYGYTLNNSAAYGTFYDTLDSDGTLRINMPANAGANTILVDSSDGNINVTLNLGSPALGADAPSYFSSFGSGSVQRIVINGGTGTDVIRIENNAGKPTSINLGGGNDVVDFSFTARNLSNITGPTTVNGGSGGDAIYVYDNNDTTGDNTNFTNSTLDTTGFGLMSYSGVEAMTYTAGTGGDAITVQTMSTPTTINGNSGNDIITLGTGAVDANTISAAMYITGGIGADRLNIGSGNSDAVAANVSWDGSGGGDSLVYNDTSPTYSIVYDITPTGVTRDGFNQPFSVSYLNTQSITINGGAGADTVSIRNSVGPTITASGNNGDDNFIVGGGNLNGFFPVDVQGGPGTDTITYDDSANTASKTWDINEPSRPNEIVYSGLILLNTAGFESVGILAGANGDTITFNGNLTRGYSVNGGGGSNQFIWNEATNYSVISGTLYPVNIDGGGGGINQLIMTQTTQGGLTFNVVGSRIYATGDPFDIFANRMDINHANCIGISLTAGVQDDRFNVYNTDPGSNYGLHGGQGADYFYMQTNPAQRNYLTLNGNQGLDTLAIDDSVYANENVPYTFAPGGGIFQLLPRVERSTGPLAITSYFYDSMQSMSVAGTTGSNTFDVNGLNAGGPMTIQGSAGNDTYNVFGSLFGASAPVTLTLADSAGFDTFNLNDQDLTNVSNAVYQHNAAGVVRVGTQIPATGIDITNINGGAGADVLQVFALPAAAGQLRFFGGPGNDALTTVNFTLGNIANRITFDGQGGTGNAITLSDNLDATGDTVHLDQNSVGAYPGDNLFGVGGSLSFFNTNSLALTLGTGADTVYAQPLATATVSINGNNPTTVPGDKLNLATAALTSPSVNGTPASGNLTSTNRPTMTWTNFEGTISIDAVVPTVIAADINLNGIAGFAEVASRQSLDVRFSENVSSLLAPASLQLTNLTTGQVIPTANIAVEYVAATNTARFTFPGYANGVLPDGNYQGKILAGLPDFFGNALPADANFSFFFLNGDANHDRSVDIADFSVLAARFNLPGTFSQGDFNYDGIAGIGDFSILASKFNTTLPAPSDVPRAVFRSASSGISIGPRDDYDSLVTDVVTGL